MPKLELDKIAVTQLTYHLLPQERRKGRIILAPGYLYYAGNYARIWTQAYIYAAKLATWGVGPGVINAFLHGCPYMLLHYILGLLS